MHRCRLQTGGGVIEGMRKLASSDRMPARRE